MSPFRDSLRTWLLDLPIACDLRGGSHRRGNLDLWPLHGRELIRALALGNPRIVCLYEILLDMFIVERGGLLQRGLPACIRLARIIGGRLPGYGASTVLHRIAFMLGEQRWIGRGHRQQE